ncbi:VanZ family protein [Streptomyces sp. NEAU-W12]|uniref:VanZ family protein n=1 Tax=Streptomyces sp. NEAU-W12 TaxID=2994668 RepID=UPI00224A7B57|nr:VanZ family protein [Streptomyces sp. NEAU-W12]MCX2927483.1 VanZ family protein [Streptomyces sp. NEAU-W12]
MNVSFQIGAPLVLGPLLAAYAVVLALRARRGTAGSTGRYAVLRFTVVLYAAAVLSITVFPLNVTWGEYANLMPWYSQVNWLPLLTMDVSALPNVVMLVPLGLLFPLVSSRAASAGRVTVLTAIASAAIESAQMLSYVVFNNGRSVDINDLIANTLGGLIGWALLRAALRTESLGGALRGAALPGSAVALGTADPSRRSPASVTG